MCYLFNNANKDTYKRTVGNHVNRVRDPQQRQLCRDDILMLQDLVNMESPTMEVM
jgi:hypothetical protein